MFKNYFVTLNRSTSSQKRLYSQTGALPTSETRLYCDKEADLLEEEQGQWVEPFCIWPQNALLSSNRLLEALTFGLQEQHTQRFSQKQRHGQSKNQRQLCGLMATKVPPHVLQHLNDKYRFIDQMLHYDAATRPEASSVVLSIKTLEGLDLKSRYGYKW